MGLRAPMSFRRSAMSRFQSINVRLQLGSASTFQATRRGGGPRVSRSRFHSGRATSPITCITGGWGHPQRLVQSSVRGPGLRALMCRSRAGFGCFSTRDYALRDQWSDVPHFAGDAARVGTFWAAIMSGWELRTGCAGGVPLTGPTDRVKDQPVSGRSGGRRVKPGERNTDNYTSTRPPQHPHCR